MSKAQQQYITDCQTYDQSWIEVVEDKLGGLEYFLLVCEEEELLGTGLFDIAGALLRDDRRTLQEESDFIEANLGRITTLKARDENRHHVKTGTRLRVNFTPAKQCTPVQPADEA